MIVCHCRVVTSARLEAAVNAGAVTVDEVITATAAATDCEGCKELVEAIVTKALERRQVHA